MLARLKACLAADRLLYTSHARKEMRAEEFGPINEQEVYETVASGKVIEDYPDDQPYPSVLILGYTVSLRPLHVVCAYNDEDDMAIVITVYQPDPSRWVDFRRRRQ
jgi:hypothetical protein